MALSTAVMVKKKDIPLLVNNGGQQCLGLLLSPDLLATAGHCIERGSCSTSVWLFPPNPKKSRGGEIFHCKEIVEKRDEESLEGEIDYALVRLQGKVTGRQFFKLRENGKMADNAKLMAVSYGGGLTPGVNPTGSVVKNDQENMFFVALDLPAGHSGGPVIDARTGIVEGIIVTRTIFFASGIVSAGVVRTTRMASSLPESNSFSGFIHKFLISLL